MSNTKQISRAWFSFETNSFYCDTAGLLTQADCYSVWRSLPTTGCAWVDKGHLYVQQCEGAIAFDLGEVESGVSRASEVA